MDEREAQRQVFINPPQVEYSHQNPHPLFGKDPNILNAQGHTEYPKWVKIDGKEVLAQDAKHEKRLLGEGKQALEPHLKKKSWDN